MCGADHESPLVRSSLRREREGARRLAKAHRVADDRWGAALLDACVAAHRAAEPRVREGHHFLGGRDVELAPPLRLEPCDAARLLGVERPRDGQHGGGRQPVARRHSQPLLEHALVVPVAVPAQPVVAHLEDKPLWHLTEHRVPDAGRVNEQRLHARVDRMCGAQRGAVGEAQWLRALV